jgi:hypothetical protein
MLDLSQVGKPKAGRPGPRRKPAEADDTDTAAILMQMADTARSGASGGPWQRGQPMRFPCAPVCLGSVSVLAQDIQLAGSCLARTRVFLSMADRTVHDLCWVGGVCLTRQSW